VKYLNDPHDGCIGPKNHPIFISKDEINSFLKFSTDGLIINFPCNHVLHEKSLDWRSFWLLSGCSQEFSTIFRIMIDPGWPNWSCQTRNPFL